MKKIMMVDDEPDQIFTVREALEDADADYEIIPLQLARIVSSNRNE